MDEIDALNRALRRSGQPVILRKINGLLGQNPTDVKCRAMVRGYTAAELTTNITQQDSFVILSPTEINNAVWPFVQPFNTTDVRIPSKNRGDKIVINNHERAVQAGVGIYIGDSLVRIEVQVR